MKTLQAFSRNRLYNFFIAATLCCSYTFSQEVAKETIKTPGIVESLEKSIQYQRSELKKLYQSLEQANNSIDLIGEFQEMKLHPIFLKALISYSDKSYLELIKSQECHFYSLLENDLIRYTNRPLKNVIIQVKRSSGRWDNQILEIDDFIKYSTDKYCPTYQNQKKEFSKTNVMRLFYKKSFDIPKDQKSCNSIISKWKKDLMTPWLCRIPLISKWNARYALISPKKLSLSQKRLVQAVAKEESFFQEKVNFKNRIYLKRLCSSFHDKKTFCDSYIKKDVWNSVLSGGSEEAKILPICSNILNESTIRKEDIVECESRISKNPSICNQSAGSKGSLFPYPSCKELSDALMVTKINVFNSDCPSQSSNFSINNFIRSYYLKEDMNVNQCEGENFLDFYYINDESNYGISWPFKICHGQGKEKVCREYIPFLKEKNALSEENVTADLLKKNLAIKHKLRCKIVNEKKFKPSRLAYKSGCFIVKNLENCNIEFCDQKVFIDQKQIQHYSTTGAPNIDYFTSSYKTEQFTLKNISEKELKFKSKVLKNRGELIRFLKSSNKKYAHGIGCIESFLPVLFKKTYLNQCSPIPFIISGYLKKDTGHYFSVHIPMDNFYIPRLISWNSIFSAVKEYQQLHPLKLWSFYGFY